MKKLNLRFLFAAEAFTEKFRDYLTKTAALKNLHLDTLNIYGTADIGAMAWETPTTILSRRLAMRNQKLFESVFSKLHKTPTLAQYNPLFVTFEAMNGEILLSGNNTIPLVRYAIGDHGGTMSFAKLSQTMHTQGINFKKAAHRFGVSNALCELPLVYVYERKDFSTTLYGLQIYPETIREVLIDKPLSRHLTGKFTMFTKYDNKQDQYLEVHLELRKGKKPKSKIVGHALKHIVLNLRTKNSEFRELLSHLGPRAHPRISLWPAEHPLYFKPGIKQKWVKNNGKQHS